MIQPTDKQKQEAREIANELIRFIHSVTSFEITAPVANAIETTIREGLSSRDVEVREVLEGLVMRTANGRCWCCSELNLNITGNHEPRCLAAQRLWGRVQPR